MNRDDAIVVLKNEGADISEENIQAVMKEETKEDDGMEDVKVIRIKRKKTQPKQDKTDIVIDSLNALNKNINALIDIQKQHNHPIHIPEIKVPEIKAPEVNVDMSKLAIPEIKVPEIVMPSRPKRSYTFNIHRDQNGKIVSVEAKED